MTEQSIHPPPTVGTEDIERLLTAAREALSLLDRMDAHLPIDAPRVGGEAKVRKALREAVHRCSYELRPCEACDDGTTHAPVRHQMERPRTIVCGECSGTGQTRVFTYMKPKARRGR